MIRLPVATSLALTALIAASPALAQTAATAVMKTGDGKDAGVVTVTGNATNIGEAVTVTLSPTISGNSISQWTCTGTPIKLMPGSCRGG